MRAADDRPTLFYGAGGACADVSTELQQGAELQQRAGCWLSAWRRRRASCTPCNTADGGTATADLVSWLDAASCNISSSMIYWRASRSCGCGYPSAQAQLKRALRGALSPFSVTMAVTRVGLRM